MDALSAPQLERVRHCIEDNGYSMTEARYSPAARYAIWADYFSRMVAAINPSAKLYFATGCGHDLNNALARAGARYRLASYWWLRDMPDDAVSRFVEGETLPQSRVKKAAWCSKSYLASRAIKLQRRVSARSDSVSGSLRDGKITFREPREVADA